MKKRVLSLILALVMVLTLCPTMSFAAGAEGTPLTGDLGADYTITAGGAYYLASDVVTGNIIIENGAAVTLDLCGHVLKCGSVASVIAITDGSLTLKDSGTDVHYFQVNANGLWVWQEVFSGTADYTFDTANGLRKAGAATDDIPAENSVIAVTGGCITGGCETYGGGIRTSEIDSLTVTGGNIVGNTASINGGGVYIYGKVDGRYSFEGCNVIGNTPNTSAGGVRMEAGTLTMTNCNVSYNKASAAGGICSRVADGGTCKLVINGSNLIGNSASVDDAGAVYSADCLEMTECVVKNNSAGNRGGGICTGGTTTIKDCTFANNTSAKTGGAVYIIDGTVTATDCDITGNKAAENGGGIYVGVHSADSPGKLIFSGGKISRNISGRTGGGIFLACFYATDNPALGQAILTDVELSENKAVSGGAVGTDDCTELLMSGCTVTGNEATEYGGGIYKPGENSTSNSGYTGKIVLLDTEITGNTAGTNGGGVYYRKTLLTSCFVEGTRISMADGTTKNIEDVEVGDEVKTFDHESGTVSSAKVYIAWKEQMGPQVTFKLHFEGGKTVHCVASHCFLEKESRKYQTFSAGNAESYVGQSFYGEDGQWHKLESVTIEEDTEWLYELYTAEHQNCFTENMLSLPADIDFMLNLYELDENLKADEKQLAADIEEYGLVSYEEADELSGGMSREWFEAAGAKYAYVALGKGLVTWTELEAQIKDIDKPESPVEEEPAPTLLSATDTLCPGRTMALLASPLMAVSNVPDITEYDAGYLTIGTGTKITGNTLVTGGTSERGNVFLGEKNIVSGGTHEGTHLSLIKIDDDAEDIEVGITTFDKPTASAPVQFTFNGSKNDEAFFFSDKTDYTDKYNESGYLELVIGSEVTEDDCNNGSVSVGNAKSYYTGETVTVIVEAAAGYVLDTITVYKTGEAATKETVTAVTAGEKYTFTMPAYDVTVTASFKSSHTHAWTYAQGGTGKENTLLAYCSAANCGGTAVSPETAQTLVIKTPTALTYDGKEKAATLTVTTLGGETVPAVSYQKKLAGGTYADATTDAPVGAGTYKAGITVKGKTAFVEYTVAQKQLTVAGTTVSDKTYDGGTAATVKKGTVKGIITGDDVTVSASGSFATKNAGTQDVTVTYSLSGANIGNYKAPEDEIISSTIKTKALTVAGTTVSGKTYDGGTAATVEKGTVKGIITGDDVTVSASGSFAAKNAGTQDVTVTYSLSGADKANYSAPEGETLCADITAKQLVISSAADKQTKVSDKTFDGSAAASAAIGTVVGIVSGDDVTVEISSAEFEDKNVGTDKSVTVLYQISGEDAGNYVKPENETKTASITAKTVNVKADNKNSYVGSDLAALTYTADALCSGDSFSGALATNADKNTVGSAYTITQGDLTAGSNYSITFTAGTYTVKPLDAQTLGFADGDQTRTYGDSAFTKTVSGASTAVIYESGNTSVATVNASTGEVTILSAGTAVITAKAAASATYASAEASYTLTVNNASQSAPSTPAKSDETVKGKANGKLTGVTDAMEYKLSTAESYTRVPAGVTTIENLPAGEYKVRYAAKANYNASPDKTLTIAAGGTMTLLFDAKGGTDVTAVSGLCWQDSLTAIPETAKEGYTFAEWNTSADGNGSKLTLTTKIESTDTYFAIWEANSYTVSFLANEGTGNMADQSFTYDAVQTLTANTFTRSGCNFTGWAKTAGAKYAEYLDKASVKNLTAEADGNVVLYAVWTAKPVYSISGKVQQAADTDPENVPDALVELKLGQDVIASTHTDTNGDYVFTGIISGEYNIVVTGHASGTQDKVKTTLVLLENESKSGVDVLLPRGNVSSVVEVKNDTPQIIAGGLDNEAAAQAGGNLSDTIRLVLTVESAEDLTETAGAPAAAVAAQTAIKQEASGKTVEFIDMDVTRYVNATDTTIHETGNVLEIIVPFDTAGRTDITVYRFHDADGDGVLDAGQQIPMTKLDIRPAAPYTDNTYFVGDGFLAIYTKFFSAYAIGYNVVSGETGTDAKPGKCPQDETCVYAKYTDADTKAWYHSGVHFCVENGYMVGVSADKFDPNGTLSRGMIVTMLWRMEGSPVVNYAMSFKDVADGLWYTEAIRWAQSTGVVLGYDAVSFGPNDNVTREQLSAILMRYAKYKGIDVSGRADLAKFTDAKSVSGWALENVKWANAVGIITGRTETTIVPTGNATRAEAACMVQRFCETILK